MSTKRPAFDHVQAALDDIIARPEVTGRNGGNTAIQAPVKAPDSEKVEASDAATLAPDDLEMAAGKVISKAVDDMKGLIGMAPDNDFTVLMTETLGGIFAAIRGMTGNPWMRFAVAVGAIGISVIPPSIRYFSAKKQQESEKE